jgi:glucose-6-phosphate dehydrogenase assembly protein OpcA
MANAVEVDSWSADGVRLGDVIVALNDLRDRSTERGSARTAVMTLIAVAPGDEEAYVAPGALRVISGHHPARILIVRPDPDSVASLDARATLYAIQANSHTVSFEEVTLAVGGQAARHLDSLVEAFVLSDLPVAVWYVNSLPEPTDPLLNVATTVLIDSRDATGDMLLRSLLELARRRVVVDLSWIRLGPWRELLAGLFDPPETRPWIQEVTEVEVTGKPGARRLVAGWLAGQLGLVTRQVHLVDARHVEIRVTARREKETAVFTVTRGDAARTLLAEASVPGNKPLRLGASLADDPLPTSLATALTRLEPNPVWEKALSIATLLPC